MHFICGGCHSSDLIQWSSLLRLDMYDHLHFVTAPGFMFSNPSYMVSVIMILICRSHPVTLLPKRLPLHSVSRWSSGCLAQHREPTAVGLPAHLSRFEPCQCPGTACAVTSVSLSLSAMWGHSHLQTRQRALVRNQTSRHLDLEPPGLQNGERYISVV